MAKEVEIERITSQKGGTIRRILGIGLAGFFFGMGDGIVTAVLPVLMFQMGSGAAALGLIEGCSDAAFHLVRQWGRAAPPREGGKTSGLFGGVLASLQGFLAFTFSPLLVFFARTVSAVGRGLRALIPEADLDFPLRSSRTIRFYRTMERSGTVIGPALVIASLGLSPLRDVFILSFPLSLLAIASLTFLREPPRRTERASRSQNASPPVPRHFYSFFAGAGIFRLGNIAVTLALLRAYELLWRDHGAARAATLVVLLYIVHQLLYAATALLIARAYFQAGGKRPLTLGYVLLGLIYLGFIFAPPVKSYVGLLPALFFFFLLLAFGGIGQSLVDLSERPLMVTLLPEAVWESGDRALGQIRALGGLVSNVAVGVLWSFLSPTAGFIYAALLSLSGAIFLLRLQTHSLVRK